MQESDEYYRMEPPYDNLNYKGYKWQEGSRMPPKIILLVVGATHSPAYERRPPGKFHRYERFVVRRG